MEAKAAYPLPLMMIKPDLQISDLFDVSDLENLKTELKFFTEEDLEQAIRQAQEEINDELYVAAQNLQFNSLPAKNIRMVETTTCGPQNHPMNSFPAKNNKMVDTIMESPAKLSKTIVKKINFRPDRLEKNKCDLDTESEEDSEDEESKDMSDSENAPAISEINQTIEESDQLAIKLREIHDQSVKSNKRTQGGRGRKTSATRTDNSEHMNENLGCLRTGVENMNRIFQDIFACIRATKGSTVVLEEGEKEKVGRRSRDFNARFNRMLYQVEQDLTGIKNEKNQHYLRTGSNRTDLSKLRSIIRSVSVLLSSFLSFISLAPGIIFPGRFMDFTQTLVDIGTILSENGLSVLSLAQNLKYIESIHARHEEEKLVQSALGLNTRQPKPKVEVSVNKSLNQSISRPKGTLLHHQRSNLARLRRMEQDSTTNQLDVSKTIFPANRQRRKSLSFLENSLIRKSTKTPIINARNSVQSPRGGKLETEKSHNYSYSSEFEENSENSTQEIIKNERHLNSRNMEASTCGFEVPKSKSDESKELKKLLGRIHNLELLALRFPSESENTTSVRNMDELQVQDGGQKQNGVDSKTFDSSQLSDLLDKLDIISSDFSLIQYKYS